MFAVMSLSILQDAVYQAKLALCIHSLLASFMKLWNEARNNFGGLFEKLYL